MTGNIKYTTMTSMIEEGVISSSITSEWKVVVPLRAIFEAMGAKVERKPQTRQVIATTGETPVSLTLDSTMAYVNNKQISLDVPSKIFNGRTLVPVRFVSESFGANVQWYPKGEDCCNFKFSR